MVLRRRWSEYCVVQLVTKPYFVRQIKADVTASYILECITAKRIENATVCHFHIGLFFFLCSLQICTYIRQRRGI